MDFKNAIENLCAPVTHQEVADALDVSRASVRQAMLAQGAKARRKPPEGWERIVCRIAEQRSAQLHRLAEKIRKESLI
jgi:acyl-CoA reductase-like NAD-dependent aldehyde dehydrogenase